MRESTLPDGIIVEGREREPERNVFPKMRKDFFVSLQSQQIRRKAGRDFIFFFTANIFVRRSDVQSVAELGDIVCRQDGNLRQRFFCKSVLIESRGETIGRLLDGKFHGERRGEIGMIDTASQIIGGAVRPGDEIIVNQAKKIPERGLAGSIGPHDDDVLAHFDFGAGENLVVFRDFRIQLSRIGEIER